jgi:3-deoxy-D-manno-octulosonic acid kinase
MLYEPSRAGNAPPELSELFDAQWWRARGTAAQAAGGRGATLFVADGARNWVLRHYRRGGLMARLLDDRYLWTGEARTRPFREWQLLRDMHATGLPVPAPVAARYQRSGAFYRGDLITERIADAQPLPVLLDAGPLRPETWKAIGGCVRAFHDHGVCHADLNAHNVLIDGAGRVFLVDFDRGRRRAPGRWRARNLARLLHSLHKIARSLPAGRFGDDDWDLLVGAYRDTPAQQPPPSRV